MNSAFERTIAGAIIGLLLLLGIVITFTRQSNRANTTSGELPPQLLYSAIDDNNREQLFVSDLDIPNSSADESIQLTDTEMGVWEYAVAPDGKRIVYAALNPDSSSDLWLMERGTYSAEYLLACPSASCSSPSWSPDGAFLAFTRRSAAALSTTGGLSPPRVWLLNLESGETAQVFADNQTLGFSPQWSGTGSWISYVVPDPDGVGLYNLNDGRSLYYETRSGDGGAWHPQEDLILLSILRPVNEQFRTHLFLVDPDDEADITTLSNLSGADAAVEDSSAAWSPNGEWIAFRRKELEGERASLGKQLWLMRSDGSDARPLTVDLDFDHGQPAWSPDGNYLLYHRFPLRGPEITLSIWMMSVQTGEATELIRPGQRPQWLP